MANNGKYVRPVDASEDDAAIGSDERNQANDEVKNDQYDANSDNNSSPTSETSGANTDDEEEHSNASSSSSPSSPSPPITPSVREEAPTQAASQNELEQVSNSERIERMEKMIAGINDTLSRFQQSSGPVKEPTSIDNRDNSWNLANETTSFGATSGSSASIRWDHIQPFPASVPANKMWETWNRYLENFEIAASLSNVNDPVKRTQLLFLSMGSELQEIIKAAKLRPSLTSSDCYKTFICNIKNYFRSMTDTAAEHEAFTRMRQENGEAAVAYHARLMCKVRSCNYSIDDEDRFVRAQLLNGLRNRDLVRQARTYGYDTNFIVQSATRDEAFEAETRQQESPSAFEVSRVERSTFSKRKRSSSADGPRVSQYRSGQNRPPANQQRRERNGNQGWRQRCNRCFLFNHRNGQCPALNRNCNKCGKRGHFVAACRQRQVNSMQQDRGGNAGSSSEDRHDDVKQEVNALTLQDIMVECSIGSSSPIRFLIDSGADANIIGGKDWHRLNEEFKSGLAKLEMIGSTHNLLHAYGNQKPMTIACTFKASLFTTSKSAPATAKATIFHVVPSGSRSLLGRHTASDMGLLQVNVNQCEMTGEHDLFPKMPGVKVKFSVNKDVPPTKNAYYNVPAAYR
ncbi:uncharacterized protein LOC134219852 isoform X2 [Armigeres subalbatus]